MALIHGDTELTWILGEDEESPVRCKNMGKHPPPVLSQRSLHIFISAASATTDMRIFSLTHSSRVS